MRSKLTVFVGVALVLALALPRAAEVRERAEQGMVRGMPAREEELAKGFVLGEDEGIDARTEEDFRRAGLSHLLAVSGQNVTLLALLALPLLAALGIPLHQRLLWVLALIVVYVPLTGAGPTIQRAAVMGALGIVATLAGRRSSRFYALLAAAGVTLAIDPTIGADVGWQLSFVAVLGILVWARPLADGLKRWLRGGGSGKRGGGDLRGALAEGIGVTVAATLATAPLVAFHFETLSTTSLAANVLALPAVAPAMWLGMASAGAAQVPGFPTELLNLPNAVLLAYIAQIAAWCAGPDWAELEIHLSGTGLVLAYASLAVATLAWRLSAGLRRRRARRVCSGRRMAPPNADSRSRGSLVVALALVVAAGGAFWLGGDSQVLPEKGLRITFLDVGQGDAILLQPPHAPAVLVDGGPPGEGLGRKLEGAGVDRLAAAVVTHDQSDHAGGIGELLGVLPIGQILYGRLGRELAVAARSHAVPIRRVSAGTTLRAGRLRLEFLWPPPELLAEPDPGADPNQLSLVARASYRGFTALLSGDAEAEAVPLDPGPLDLLKVAHHGSEDGGLGDLLGRTKPELAVISVGAENPHGHPSPLTLAELAAYEVRTIRTDRAGDVMIHVLE